MRIPLPLSTVLRRGVVFFWPGYSRLDDPAYAGKSKPKYIVVLRVGSNDSPVVYLLPTSAKEKHQKFPFPEDRFRIPGGRYDFFELDTLIDVHEAGALEIEFEQLEALYKEQKVEYKGRLSEPDIAALVKCVMDCPRVQRRFKQTLGKTDASA